MKNQLSIGSLMARAVLPGLLLIILGGPALSGVAEETPVTFYALGDTHINTIAWGNDGVREMVEIMNELPGREFPLGGETGEPAGAIISGDLVDSFGNDPESWEIFKDWFRPAGGGKFDYPVYEGAGNHDMTGDEDFGEFNDLQRDIMERNEQRPGDIYTGENGYHYSWEWGGVRFMQLHKFAGNEPRPIYGGEPSPQNDPHNSLDFIEHVLEEKAGDSGQPVILTWHYGLRGWGLEMWWDEEDLDNLAEVLEGYNILLIIHAHEHSYQSYEWEGYDVKMAPAPYSDFERDGEETSIPKGILVFRITEDELQMAHKTGEQAWRETWSKAIDRPCLNARRLRPAQKERAEAALHIFTWRLSRRRAFVIRLLRLPRLLPLRGGEW